MRALADPRADEVAQVILTRDELLVVQAAPKELVAEPDAVGVDDVCLTVIRHLLDAALFHEVGDLRAVDALRLAGEAEEEAQGVKGDLGARGVGGEDSAEIDRIFGVAVEVRPAIEARRMNAVEQRPVSQDRQVEAVAVEADELRAQGCDALDEGLDDFPFGPIARVRRAQRPDGPMAERTFSDQGANAGDLGLGGPDERRQLIAVVRFG